MAQIQCNDNMFIFTLDLRIQNSINSLHCAEMVLLDNYQQCIGHMKQSACTDLSAQRPFCLTMFTVITFSSLFLVLYRSEVYCGYLTDELHGRGLYQTLVLLVPASSL